MRYKAIKTKLKLNKNERSFLLILMHTSKSLYNQALYNTRQHYFDTGECLTYEDNYHQLKDSDHYKTLNSSQAQGVIKKVDEAMKAFFGSNKSLKANKVKLPRYLDKNGFYPLFDRMVYKPNNEYYVLPRGNFIKRISKLFKLNKRDKRLIDSLRFNNILTELNIVIKTPKCITNKPIKEITIKPKFDGKYIEVIHTYLEEDILNMDESNKRNESMGIDLGYNNLAMCAVTNENHLLIDGKKLKSMNQWYHKRIAYLKSKRTLPKTRVEDIQKSSNNKKRMNNIILPYTKKMVSLEAKRTNQMTYGINKSARLIINHALENNVGEIIVGYNENFKDDNLGKKTNQWIKSIPLARLRDRVKYLCEENNIECNIITEEYTSKASYLDDDLLPSLDGKEHHFSGKRVKRGMYITKEGKKINADLNAALNILRKGNPNAQKLGFSGVNTPKRTYLFN